MPPPTSEPFGPDENLSEWPWPEIATPLVFCPKFLENHAMSFPMRGHWFTKIKLDMNKPVYSEIIPADIVLQRLFWMKLVMGQADGRGWWRSPRGLQLLFLGIDPHWVIVRVDLIRVCVVCHSCRRLAPLPFALLAGWLRSTNPWQSNARL